MSEHGVGDFIRGHKKAEIATGIGAAAVAAGLSIRAINANHRKKREHRQLGYGVEEHAVPLEERVKLFGYEVSEPEQPNIDTRVAAFISNGSSSSIGVRGIVTPEALGEHMHLNPLQLSMSVKRLKEAGFIEDASSLADAGVKGWTRTDELRKAEDLPEAEPFHQAVSAILNGNS